MVMTILDYIDMQKTRFNKLSKSRQDTLKREAKKLINEHPNMANANNFWKGLSAVHILEA